MDGIINITKENWGEENPRSKIKIGDKIIYYIYSKDGNSILKHELEMMDTARKNNIGVAEVYYYEKNGNLEICIMEYIKGRKAEISDTNRIMRELEKFKRIPEKEKGVFFNSIVLGPNSDEINSYNNISEYISDQLDKLCKIRMIEKIPVKFPELSNKFSFSHGDISLDNIIINNNKTYFIDWECAGYFPCELVDVLSLKDECFKKEKNDDIGTIINIVKYLRIDKEKALSLIKQYKYEKSINKS